MAEPLDSPKEWELDEETTDRLRTYAERLGAPISPDRQLSGLLARCDDCEGAMELSSRHPTAGRLLAPVLAQVLQNEIARGYGYSVDQMFYQGPSENVQACVAGLLAKVTGLDLVEQYSTSDQKIRSLLEALADGLVAGHTPRVRGACLIAAAQIIRIRPGLAISHLSAKPVVDSILQIVSDAGTHPITIPEDQFRRSDGDIYKPPTALSINIAQPGPVLQTSRWVLSVAGLMVIAALAVRDPSAINSIPHVDKRLGAAELNGIEGILLGLINQNTDITVSVEEGTLDDPEVVLSGGIQGNWTAICRKYAVTYGEIAAIQPEEKLLPDGHSFWKEDQILALHRDILTRQGATRRAAAEACGVILTIARVESPELWPQLKQGVRGESELPRELAAECIGYLSILSSEPQPNVPNSLLNAVTDVDDSAFTTALRTIGFAKAYIGEADSGALVDDLPDWLVDGLQTPSESWQKGSPNWFIALTVGELHVAADTTCADSPVSELRESVQRHSNLERRRLARILGEAVIRYSSPDQIARRIHRKSGAERNQPAEVLGEILAAQTQRAESTPLSALSSRVQSESGQTRKLSAIILGEAAAIQHFTDDSLIDALAARHRVSQPSERARAAQLLGEVTTCSSGAPEEEYISCLSKTISTSCVERRQFAAKALGEAVGIQLTKPDDDVIEVLQQRVRATRGDERQHLAQSLAEIVVVHPEQDGPGLEPLRIKMLESTGLERRRTARVLGELVGIDINQQEAISTIYRKLCSILGSDHRLPCELLGEILLLLGRDADIFEEPTHNHLQGIVDEDRSRGAYVIGTIAILTTTDPPQQFIERLREDVVKSSDASRHEQMELLGECIAVTAERSDSEFQPLIDKLKTSTGHERRITAQALGESDISYNRTPTTTTAIEKLARRLLDLRSESSRAAEVIHTIVAVMGIGGEPMVRSMWRAAQTENVLAPMTQTEAQPDLERYYLLDNEAQMWLFRALSTAIETDATDLPVSSLRHELRRGLNEQDQRKPEARLALSRVLTLLPH